MRLATFVAVALFDYGYQRAIKGYDWAKKPPMF